MVATTAVGLCQLLTGAAIDSMLFGRIMARDSSLPAFYKATSSQPSLLPLYTTQRVQARPSPRLDVGARRTAVCNLRITAEVLVHQKTLVVILFPLAANRVQTAQQLGKVT
jgi:hypothetical protein